MPQAVTYSVGAKVDKGPDVKSQATVDAASYSATVDEVVCRCSKEAIELNLSRADMNCVDMIVITADKYMNDKDACMPKNGNKLPPCKYVQYYICPPSTPASGTGTANCPDPRQQKTAQNQNCPPAPGDCDFGPENGGPNTDTTGCCGPYDLTRPHSVTYPFIHLVFPNGIDRIVFLNNLASDIKVSVLVVRRLRPKCAPTQPCNC